MLLWLILSCSDSEQDAEQERILQKAKVEVPVDTTPKSFQGKGNRLSDVSNNQVSAADVRAARLKFYQNNNKKDNKDLDV